MSLRRWLTASEGETEALGATLAAELVPDGILLLFGEMGSGKTVLTRGLARGLGIDPLTVQSPTFTLIREYEGDRRLIHVDLYRLEPAEVAALGLEELLAGPGVKVVEWAERLPFPVPRARRLRLRSLSTGSGRQIDELDDDVVAAEF